MQWVNHYQLFLFDLDGLLVNTEELHYRAYQKMLADRGLTLGWDFPRYCQAAHYSSEHLRSEIYRDFPSLLQDDWNLLYQEKKEALHHLLEEKVELMAGVEVLLQCLKDANIQRCVVTHSSNESVSLIRQQHPILNTIPVWMTRENYTQPKPNPECYLYAIEQWAGPKDRVIGFEDTPKGIHALMGTRAQSVLISKIDYPETQAFVEQGILHYPSFEALEGIGDLLHHSQ